LLLVLAIFCCTELTIKNNFVPVLLFSRTRTLLQKQIFTSQHISNVIRLQISHTYSIRSFPMSNCHLQWVELWILTFSHFSKSKIQSLYLKISVKKQNMVWRLQSYKVLSPQKWQETFSPESFSRFHVNKVRKLQLGSTRLQCVLWEVCACL